MPRIAIFDSGVGGLSIYKEVRATLPDNEYIFVSDNLGYPYGDKPTGWLVERVMKVCRDIKDRCRPDILIVACNTASTVVLPELRRSYSMPIVGVVPAIKPAARLTKTGHIGLLATPATIERSYTDQLIESFASGCSVTKVGSIVLVQLAEQLLRGQSIDQQIIATEISPFIDQPDLDVLIMACTHFPLLNNQIEALFKANERDVLLLDSSTAIAKRVSSLLEEQNNGQISLSQSVKPSTAFFTREIADEPRFVEQLNNFGLSYQGLLSAQTVN